MKQYITGQIAYKSDSQSEPYGCRNTLFGFCFCNPKKREKPPNSEENGGFFSLVNTSHYPVVQSKSV